MIDCPKVTVPGLAGVVILSAAGLMTIKKVVFPVAFAVSVTVTATFVKEPAVVGVPFSKPALFRFSPPGNPVTDHV